MGIFSFICLVVMIVGLVLYIIEVNKTDVKPILPPWSSIEITNKENSSYKLLPILMGSLSPFLIHLVHYYYVINEKNLM